jgi:hypothetical protein
VSKRRKAPKNTFWRAAVLWGRLKVKGRDIKWSLRTTDPVVAAARVQAERERQIAAAHYGDARQTWEDTVVAWADHIATQVGPATATRYAVSLKQLEPWLLNKHVDEIDKALVIEIVRERRKASSRPWCEPRRRRRPRPGFVSWRNRRSARRCATARPAADARRRCGYRCVVDACVCPTGLPMIGKTRPPRAPNFA